MNTPIADFVRAYQAAGTARLHMPGHKGRPFLGCEGLDITEVHGADSLYEAQGIIDQSEKNAAALFGSGRTVFGTEGSTQCIKAMLYLTLLHRRQEAQPTVLAARNVHKAFLYGAAALDLQVQWLPGGSLCSSPVSPQALEAALAGMKEPPMAVYLTSPDYLGGMSDLNALGRICHRHETLLLVDNAHGAYLHFLEKPCHPMDLGADLCCDSAHKTLPALTGGAYLHCAKARQSLAQEMKNAMAMFGSTSPSYLTLASLDLCNRYLETLPDKLCRFIPYMEHLRQELRRQGYQVLESDPLRLTVCAPAGSSGLALADRLRRNGVECEYADPEFLVLMATPENSPAELARILPALGQGDGTRRLPSPVPAGQQEMTIRQALLSPHRRVSPEQSLGRICAAPTVSCPPAIPIVVCGQRIDRQALELFRHYQVETVEVVAD